MCGRREKFWTLSQTKMSPVALGDQTLLVSVLEEWYPFSERSQSLIRRCMATSMIFCRRMTAASIGEARLCNVAVSAVRRASRVSDFVTKCEKQSKYSMSRSKWMGFSTDSCSHAALRRPSINARIDPWRPKPIDGDDLHKGSRQLGCIQSLNRGPLVM